VDDRGTLTRLAQCAKSRGPASLVAFTVPWKENQIFRSQVGTMVAILAAAAGFLALGSRAEAQISGSTGGDVVDHEPVTVQPIHGSGAFQWGVGLTRPLVAVWS
jgi:hypothetical protein